MIGGLDMLFLVGYLVGIVVLGVTWSMRAKARQANAAAEAADYFLAGRRLGWPVVGLALFATNISCVHMVSLAQSGYDTGLLNGNFEWMAAFTLVALALFFAPIYLRSNATTLPDYMQKRYDRSCRDWLTIVSIFSAIIIHIGFAFLTGGRILAFLFPELGGIYGAIVVIAVLTGIYTILGGLVAVVVTETVQTVVLILGASVMTWFALDKVGGWSAFVASLNELGATEKLSMLRPHGDASGMPWYSILLGYPVLGIWYWCADQTIVQRVLGARSEGHARGGALFCAILKIFPVFIFVLPGVLAYVLASKGQLNLGALGSGDTKDVYAVMITQLLPVGFIGLVLAALIAALMSTVAGALNSIATLTSYDLYQRFVPNCTDRQLVRVGRWSGAVALMLSIALVPLLDNYGSLFNGLNDIIAHIAPPITGVFLLGVLWPRANAVSARWTLWVGSALGAVVFGLNKLAPGNPLGSVPFMLMAFYLLVACLLLQTVIVLKTSLPSETTGDTLAWSTPAKAFSDAGVTFVLPTAMVVGVFVALYWGFA